jgi:hypothetical protein
MLEWEKVTKETTNRLRVPLGWIVSKEIWRDSREGTGCSTAMVFIFDPLHLWKIKEEKKEKQP